MSRGQLVHHKTIIHSFLLLFVLVVVKDVNVVIPVVMAVVVIVVSQDIDRPVPLEIRAVRLLCQVNHDWDMLIHTLVV